MAFAVGDEVVYLPQYNHFSPMTNGGRYTIKCVSGDAGYILDGRTVAGGSRCKCGAHSWYVEEKFVSITKKSSIGLPTDKKYVISCDTQEEWDAALDIVRCDISRRSLFHTREGAWAMGIVDGKWSGHSAASFYKNSGAYGKVYKFADIRPKVDLLFSKFGMAKMDFPIAYTGEWKISTNSTYDRNQGYEMFFDEAFLGKQITKPKKPIMKRLGTMMKKLLDADTQALVKAGFINGDLELTNEGTFALRDIMFDANKAALVEAAKAVIAEEEAEAKK